MVENYCTLPLSFLNKKSSTLCVYKGPGKRGHIVANDVSWAAQTGKHLLRTQIVSEENHKHLLYPRTQNLCPQQMLRERANGETFVSATICPRLPGP